MPEPRFLDFAYIGKKDLEKGTCVADEQVAPSRSTSTAESCTLDSDTQTMASLSGRQLSTTSNSRRPLVRDEAEGKKKKTEEEEAAEAKADWKKKMSWWQATTVMIAETVSLGILSLPAAVMAIGLIAGGILTVSFGVITTYTGYLVHRFKMRHPEIGSFADAGDLIAGRVGRWIVELMTSVYLAFIMAGHIIIFRSMVFKLSEGNSKMERICGVLWTVLALFIFIFCTLPRALKTNSWFSIFSCISIMLATFVTMGGVSNAFSKESVDSRVTVVLGDAVTFAMITAAVSNILLSFTGHIAYLTIINEMREPKDFPKALITTNAVTITLYSLAGCVIYHYVGDKVESPALDSAPSRYAKIAYALAVPTIIVAGVIAALVACKRTYDIVWRKHPEVKKENTPRAWVSWIIIVVTEWVVAWLIGNVIPGFNTLLSVIGAAVGTWICLGFPAIFWLYDAWHEGGWIGRKTRLLVGLHVFLLFLCIVASVLGLYGSIKEIQVDSGKMGAFPCNRPQHKGNSTGQ